MPFSELHLVCDLCEEVQTEDVHFNFQDLKKENAIVDNNNRFFFFQILKIKIHIFGLAFRQGNIHNHLANCVKATKISGITYIEVLFRFFGGTFF